MTDSSTLENLGTADKLFLVGVVLVLVSGALPFLAADEAVLPEDDDAQINLVTGEVDAELTDEIAGTDADDWYLIAGAAVVGGLIVGVRSWDKITLGVAGLATAVVLAISLLYISDPVWAFNEPYKSEVEPLVSAGTGLYLALVGGLLQAAGVVKGYRQDASSPDSREPAPQREGHRETGTARDRDQPSAEQSRESDDERTRRDRSQPPQGRD